MAEIFLLIGLGVFIIGGIGFLIAAFKTSILWGLGCLFLAPIQIIYLFVHWDSVKKPFLLQLAGGVVMLTSAYLQGQINI
ncbi:hypothetical protein DSCW_65090 [Desulfosarcina widdelii]|uniref:Uncharacterized protein n=1 Tax=Desulfosarcina widdelii TaxID=947919 RepID=A0A5K7ZAM4_9BACT|nr:hypothetical protein [Desulfosarcina widdelii]BBO79092.1 hypothetical protein DSCW_65090 [Desulfosarcina widdelii]